MENQPQTAPSGSKSTMWIVILVVIIILAGGAYYFLSQDDGTNTNSTNNENAVVNSASNTNENTNAAANANVNQSTNENVNNETNTNTVVDTGDWNAYHNEEQGFSVSYPETGEVLSNNVYDPILTTGVEGCTFNYNGQGLGRGISLTRMDDGSVFIDGQTLSVKRWACDSGQICLETIQLADNIAVIELGLPDSDENQTCQRTLDEMLTTFKYE